MTQENMFIHF